MKDQTMFINFTKKAVRFGNVLCPAIGWTVEGKQGESFEEAKTSLASIDTFQVKGYDGEERTFYLQGLTLEQKQLVMQWVTHSLYDEVERLIREVNDEGWIEFLANQEMPNNLPLH